ncbi:MAG: hypothetical protein WKF96_15410 [Solirubrobacteraceae bacterium]
MSRLRRRLPLAIVACFVAATPATADQQGPDYITSDNVQYLGSFKPATGLTAGARIIGKYMYVTSSKDLEIFDISTPEEPALVGNITANIQFENEEVPTNGKLLGISSDLLHSSPECLAGAEQGGLPADGGCLRLYDVRDPADVKELAPVPGAGDHTSTCILDCTYLYGSSGSIVDARTALTDGKAVKLPINWKDAVEAQVGEIEESCHNVNEVRPGIIITACQPSHVLSVRAEDGGSPTSPKVLYTGHSKKELDQFIHSARWPRAGTDKFILIGGERNFEPQCDETVSAFQTFDASRVAETGTYTPIDEIQPVNGDYLNSNPPFQVLGCSVHWFEEHPTFTNGGLVALAEYENGIRFLQITDTGEIKEQGFFIPLGGSASAPHWVPGTDIIYSIDYERGIDVLRYKGSHYVPVPAAEGGQPGAVQPEPGAAPGTEGAQPQPVMGSTMGPPMPPATPTVCARSAGFDRALAQPDDRGLRFDVARKEERPFKVDVFQVSKGRRVLRERLVARFGSRTESFSWAAKRSRHGGPVQNGTYFVRFTMDREGSETDVRRVTLRRSNGRFRAAPSFYDRNSCGILRSFKLGRAVYGGRNGAPLSVSYRLNSGVDSVSIVALRGKKVVRRFTDLSRTPGHTEYLRLPASVGRAGSNLRVRITVRRAGTVVRSTLTSHRL